MDDLRPRLIPFPPGEEERRALRGFGIGLGALLFFFAWRGHHRSVLAALGAASLTLGLTAPRALKPLYRAWMPVVKVLGFVNLWLICGILYYVVVTPYALLLRLCGWKALDAGFEPERTTYWEEKEPRDAAESARRIF